MTRFLIVANLVNVSIATDRISLSVFCLIAAAIAAVVEIKLDYDITQK